jgi:DNA replication protein DnaC
MSEVCSICGGSGLRVVQEGGRQFAQDCVCRIERRTERMLGRAHIPTRYEHCTLDSYIVSGPRGDDRTLAGAHLRARKFVEDYHVKAPGTGLLLTGSIGVGKTHLAVGILKKLIQERGVQGIFCDYRELLKEVQNSYNPSVAATEMGILRPVFEAEVLVLDELGASKPTEWVWDTVAHILNARYNDLKTTIITTNYSNLGPLVTEAVSEKELQQPDTADGQAARAAMKKETLGDRIGERMRSRLQEMCFVVEMYGKDYRGTEKRASFAIGKNLTIVTPAPQPTAEESSPCVGNTTQGSEPQQQELVVGAARMGKNNNLRKRPSPTTTESV